jgi:hypothetical protein
MFNGMTRLAGRARTAMAPTAVAVATLLLATAAATAATASAVAAPGTARHVSGAGTPRPAVIGNRYAVVAADGTLTAGGNVTGVTHLNTGQYEVAFTTNVSHCAYVATTVNASSQALQVFTAGGHLSADDVYVETKNQGGGLTDGPFNLVVDCGGPFWAYAVVGYTANLVRASAGVTMTTPGTGRYDLRFPAWIGGCSYLATVGDPGSALVFNPAGVYTGSGSNGHTVYVETKNQGGGLSSGIPFQLAVVCPGAARTREAVVGANGLITRGSALTSSYDASTGQYAVVTNRMVTGCATVATRGSVNTAVPFTPATVEITPGPAHNTVGVQVRDLLFFGGNLDDQTFHAAIVC